MSKKLLVCIGDRLSALVAKGEVTDRYYNPGDLFDEVHILMTNDDQPDPAAVQKMVGQARLYLHNLPGPSFQRTLGWQPVFMQGWIEQGVALARQIGPLLMRAHGNGPNGYLAAQIKRQLGIPLVVSLHNHPDEGKRRRTAWWPTWRQRLLLERHKVFERETLRRADCVIGVYEPIREYAVRYGAQRVEVIYNVINPTHLRRKTDYELHSPVRIISVGNQMPGKIPDNVIRAVAQTSAELTLVGRGEYHEYLRSVARERGIEERVVIFRPSVPNDQLCEMLPDYDIFATHTDYLGIPKAVMEPLLTGLPVVLNQREGKLVPELQGDWVLLVDNTPEGYLGALNRLLTDHALREALGQRGYAYAQEHFAPQKMEQQVIDLYRELVPGL